MMAPSRWINQLLIRRLELYCDLFFFFFYFQIIARWTTLEGAGMHHNPFGTAYARLHSPDFGMKEETFDEFLAKFTATIAPLESP